MLKSGNMDKVYSIELDPSWYAFNVKKFGHINSLTLMHCESAFGLQQIYIGPSVPAGIQFLVAFLAL